MAYAPNTHDRRHVEHYLIPVIVLMQNGTSHTEAFKILANKLAVEVTTVRDRCTRGIGLIGKGSTQEFVRMVRSGEIQSYLKQWSNSKSDLDLIAKKL